MITNHMINYQKKISIGNLNRMRDEFKANNFIKNVERKKKLTLVQQNN